ncbi:MAG: DUF2946 family protein [Xanthobacteraceae bacterium]
MRWYRSRKHIGSCLALLALWLQFVLPFAHHHPEDFAPTFGSSGARPAISADPAGPATAPSDHGNRLAHDDCAICALMFLAGTALPGQAPALSKLAAVRPLLPAQTFALDLALDRYLPFRTRAPPLA